MIFFLDVLAALCQVLTFAILARALLSWFPLAPRNFLVVFLHQITEPIMMPLRRVIPRLGFLDITPVVAILILQVIYTVIEALKLGAS